MSTLTINVDGAALAGLVQPPIYPEQVTLCVPHGMDEFLITLTRRTPPTHISPGYPAERPSLNECAVVVALLAARVIGR